MSVDGPSARPEPFKSSFMGAHEYPQQTVMMTVLLVLHPIKECSTSNTVLSPAASIVNVCRALMFVIFV